MRTHLPRGLVLVAILQFLPPLILPPSVWRGVGPLALLPVAAVFLLLGVNLLRRQAWSRTATVFVQGFNILVRLLTMISHAVQGGQPGNPLDVWLVGTSLVSILLSALILYYVDLPDVQVLMQ